MSRIIRSNLIIWASALAFLSASEVMGAKVRSKQACMLNALTIFLEGQPAPPIIGFFSTPAQEGLQALINDFDNAQASIHYIIFNETDIQVATSLVNAKSKGRDVQVIHDAGNWQKNLAAKEPAALLLQNAGIVTPSSVGFQISHAKAAAIDSGTPQQAVWITSRNATTTYPVQRDAGVKTNDPTVIQDFEAIFAADIQNAKTGGTFTPQLKSSWIVVSPVNAEPRITSLIEEAVPGTNIFATSENWGNPGIQNALITAQSQGINVQVLGPLQDLNVNPQFNFPYLQALQKAGVNAMGMPGPGTAQIPYMHQKFVSVVTLIGPKAYLGSVNLSRSSASTIGHFTPPSKPSREIGLIFTDVPTIQQLNANFAADEAVATTNLTVPPPASPPTSP